MNDKLLEALEEISDRHIQEAVQQKRSRSKLLLRTAAAVVVVMMTLVLLRSEPTPVAATELIQAAQYTPPVRPDIDAYTDLDAYDADFDAYVNQFYARLDTVSNTMEGLQGFWESSCQEFMTGTKNQVWSPVNAYMTLAMLAQTTSGSTRQEILDVLGAESIEALQVQVRAIWETVWRETEGCTRLLANSLWLDDELEYREESLQVLGTDYYASVHRTNLDHSDSDADIQNWIDQQTCGLLEGMMPSGDGPSPLSRRVLTLASTLYVEDEWMESFDPKHNTEAVFHAPGGDVTCTYMNGLKKVCNYGRGENYTAVTLGTMEGCDLLLILPDVGTTPADLLRSGDWLTTELSSKQVQLSMPKFDISTSTDLIDGLKRLGIREAFSPFGGDFSEALSLKGPIYADSVRQSARILVDETGVRAASGSSVTIAVLGESETVNVVLDRPFLFVLSTWDIPLFAGVVANPCG